MFGQILKNLRTESGKTQQQIADYLGISRAAYSHFENERNEPDRETLIKIANYFNVSIDYLLGLTKLRNSSSDNTESPYIKTIAAHIDDDVTEEQFNNIIDYIDFITNKHKKD